jgi:hypothetical protein
VFFIIYQPFAVLFARGAGSSTTPHSTNTAPRLKALLDLRGFFSSDKADAAGLPAQVKKDNAVRREKDRKDTMVLNAE